MFCDLSKTLRCLFLQVAFCRRKSSVCGRCPTPGDSYSGSICVNCCRGAVGPPWGLEFAQAVLPYPFVKRNLLIHIETMHLVVSRILSAPPRTTETMLLKQDLRKIEIKATGYKQNKHKTKFKVKKNLSCSAVKWSPKDVL